MKLTGIYTTGGAAMATQAAAGGKTLTITRAAARLQRRWARARRALRWISRSCRTDPRRQTGLFAPRRFG